MTTSLAGHPVTLRNGVEGERLCVPSANPVNFFDVISKDPSTSPVEIAGQLFLPDGDKEMSCVIVVPGSLGVAPSHIEKAALLTEAGFGACVIDPFGARAVTSTVANQTQYSFAASALDVLATAKVLADHDRIDAANIGAQGHSRGGSAVLSAAVSTFQNAAGARPLRAVYAAYPWCGHQFLVPSTGETVVRAVIGDQDEWCLPQQVQAQIHAMRLAGSEATFRLFAGAQHSFDRDTPIEMIEDAKVSPSAPTTYIGGDGAFFHPLTGESDPDLTDRDLMVYALKAGYGKQGARIGSEGDQARLFHDDMMRFWRAVL